MKIVLGLLVLVLLGTACYTFIKPVPPPQPKEADPNAAHLLLENLASALKMQSIQTGGGGNSKFANNFNELSGFYAEKIKPALPGEQSSFYGYIVRLEENPAGDNFTTNFRLIAYPAQGYTGDTFTIDKNEKIEKIIK